MREDDGGRSAAAGPVGGTVDERDRPTTGQGTRPVVGREREASGRPLSRPYHGLCPDRPGSRKAVDNDAATLRTVHVTE
jgi:hypothetical protein